MPDDVVTKADHGQSIHARRLHRLEAIATLLSGLYNDLQVTQSTERQAKASIYMDLPPSMSHGERQARASHETVAQDTEVQQIKAQIQQLTEERDLIKFFVEWDVGG